MGNRKSKPDTDAVNEEAEEPLSIEDWKQAVQREREQQQQALSDYDLFIRCMWAPQSISGCSIIATIALETRLYIGSVQHFGYSLYDDTAQRFVGARISVATHPVDGRIYVADSRNVFLLHPGADPRAPP